MNGDGGNSFESEPFFEDVVGVLEAALKFPDDVPEVETRRAVSAALFDGGIETLDAEGMKRKIEERVVAFLDADPSPYVLVSSFSARYFEGLEETEVAGCRLAFHRSAGVLRRRTPVGRGLGSDAGARQVWSYEPLLVALHLRDRRG